VARKLFYTYIHRRNDTGAIFYVGKGIGNRYRQKTGRNDRWHKIVAKHGFSCEIVAPWEREDDAFAHEVFLIKTLRELGYQLVNLTDGGEGPSGHRASDESREKMRRAQAIRRATPGAEERRLEALREAKKSAHHRSITSERMRRQRRAPEARAKQSADSKVAWADAQERRRRGDLISAGSSTPEAKANRSAASKKKLRDPRIRAVLVANILAANERARKPVVCLDTGEVYACCSAAGSALSIAKGQVRAACLGRQKTAGGLRWAFVTATVPGSPPSLDSAQTSGQ
jgi:hypothetical protein